MEWTGKRHKHASTLKRSKACYANYAVLPYAHAYTLYYV